jgi:glycosyltransferase involved in cell wall biosynthesis
MTALPAKLDNLKPPAAETQAAAVDVSVVIPCLNEANSLGVCIEKAINAFRSAGLRGEVVVADNGSTDGSVQIAENLGARIVHVQQRGYGAALRAGIEAARGAFIIMGDADDSYDFGDVPRFVEKWRAGNDVVMGNRFRGEIKQGAMPWHHKYIGNPGLSGLLNLFFSAGIGDSHCGMRGFTRAVYDQMDLRSTGMEFASEFVIKAAQLRAKVTEIPITLWPDKRGRPPHLRSFRDGWRHLRFMFLYAPNWLFLLHGGALVILVLFLVFWLYPGPREVSPLITLDVNNMI